jgi:20S proteasome subunit beta 2
MAALTDSNAGFSFENALRNRVLGQRNLHLPKATSTGTTIVGVVYESGIVLGADTRATEGPIVADKNCEKVRPPLTLTTSRLRGRGRGAQGLAC